MSTLPPTISPRLRSRESSNLTTAATAPSPAPATHSKLRVLIRLPHVAAESKASARFQFAVGLLAALKRRYAAAAFVVFLVAMVAMLLHGKSGETPRNDRDSEAPRWNSAVTVPAAQQPPSGRQTPSGAALHSGDRQPRPAAPAAQSAVRQGRADAQGRPALPPIVTASADHVPDMPRANPSREGFVDPTPPWRGQPSGPPGDPYGRTFR
jgi:hypothetical protein